MDFDTCLFTTQPEADTTMPHALQLTSKTMDKLMAIFSLQTRHASNYDPWQGEWQLQVQLWQS